MTNMRELGLPVRKWVPNWLALISIFIIILPIYNPQIQISVVSGTKRSIFRQKNKTKRSKKKAAHNTYKAGAKG